MIDTKENFSLEFLSDGKPFSFGSLFECDFKSCLIQSLI